MTDFLAAATYAVQRGWHVFPLTPRGKYPARGFTDWEHNATADPDRLAAWWRRAPYNVGIACGPSNLVIIDLDLPKPGEQAPAACAGRGLASGEQVFRHLCTEHGQPYPDDTFTVTTRRGGTHLYFTAPPGLDLGNTSGARGKGLGWLIDTRARGGYVVAPGSHVAARDGTGAYTIARDQPPAPLPDWLAATLTPAPPQPASATSIAELLADLPARRLSAYGQTALTGEIERVATAPDGGRNRALNLAAWKLGKLIARGALPRDLVEHALQTAAETANTRSHDPRPPHALAAVIGYGIDAGIRAA
ncbi:bifunctional DNA primase/polymerase [Nonomuraea sp. NPDC050022]|uniref:bifunctional DNA primase/polymerase n=1 Tax=Nonomuraea sp. NPDC050022 TaxID=3364358 RepID=UPI00379A151E